MIFHNITVSLIKLIYSLGEHKRHYKKKHEINVIILIILTSSVCKSVSCTAKHRYETGHRFIFSAAINSSLISKTDFTTV